MNPKNVDRLGKVLLLTESAFITKYWPRVLKETSKLIKKIIPKK